MARPQGSSDGGDANDSTSKPIEFEPTEVEGVKVKETGLADDSDSDSPIPASSDTFGND